MDLGLAKPPPPDTLTPEAEAAREAVRAHGRARRLEASVALLVTEHGHKRIVPYEGDVVTAAAKTLLRLAESKGMRAQIVKTPTGCAVEGIDVKRGVAFRASWERGSTDGATWHEARDRYTLVDDPRPVRVNATTKTALKGGRPAGMGRVHLQQTASRSGLPMNITELTQRVKAL
jgi:hypothetical protein